MKCKSWSNKINNYVVRRLKSIKINGTQQQQQSLQSAASAQQQSPASNAASIAAAAAVVVAASSSSSSSGNNSNHIESTPQQQLKIAAIAATTATTTATMPAMPKEKATTAVSLSESNFTQLHYNELEELLLSGMAAVPATAASRMHHTCGCGAASAATANSATNENNNNSSSSRYGSKYLTNGHTSPLAAALDCVASSPLRTPRCRQNVLNGMKAAQQQQLNADGAATGPTTNTTTTTSSSSQSIITAALKEALQAPLTPPKKSANDYIFGRYIGEGSFSIVYLAVDIHTRSEYAIKVCEKRRILRERKQDYIKREREVMHLMTNVPGFVNLSCTFQDQRSLYFVMTYAKNGDLLPYINKVGSFDAACTRHYAAELLLACEHMHRRNVVHRDLKPENILLDEDMHMLIADFGSAKLLTPKERAQAAAQLACSPRRRGRPPSLFADDLMEQMFERGYAVDDDDEDEEDREPQCDDDDDADEVDSPPLRSRHCRMDARRRKGSFVGTAQYVSPEVLQNGPITPAADLWALGCIVYQMISGLPPFRGSNDYVIFKEILGCAVDFPQGFDKDAEDLVRRLLKINPRERLGAQDEFGHYESIRSHPFFAGIDWQTVRQQTPPPIYPYLPGVCKDEEFRSSYSVPGDLEPGLNERQITRLLGMELGVGSAAGSETKKTAAAKHSFDLDDAEKLERLEAQKTDKWHVFADGEVILKKGFVNKRKGLFARKRMLLLTTGPRLIYIDPVQMIKKGEIPWSPELRVEAKNFKIFFVHTPNRTYYLDDPEGYALDWVDAIESMRKFTYASDVAATATTATSSSSRSSSLAVNVNCSSAANSNSSASSNCSPTARRNSPAASCRQRLDSTTASTTATAAPKKTASN